MVESVPSRVTATKAILASQLGAWIRRYRGGAPLGFLGAIAQFESGGKMVTGDPDLGESGYFQVSASTPGIFGLPAAVRLQPEVNAYLGGLEYNYEHARLAITHPVVLMGTPDAWRMARMAFAIGASGTRKLIDAARPVAGAVYPGVMAYIARTGGMALGSQSAEKVAYRAAAVDVIWSIGQQASPGWGGLPQVPPSPPGLHPVIPSAIVAKMQSARSRELLTTAAVVAAVLAFA